MPGRNSFEDELARRRAAHRGSDTSSPTEEGREDEPIRLGWRDTLALIVAAYQILFPMLLAMCGALLIVYFIFHLYFS